MIKALFFLACGIGLALSNVQYDLPLQQARWHRVIKGEHSRTIDCFCFDYGGFSIYEERDPFNKGATEIVVRTFSKGKKGNLCQKRHVGNKVSLSFGEGYFQGVIGGFVIVQGADVFGDQVSIKLFKTKDGTPVFEGIRNIQKPLVFEKEADVVSASFYVALKVSCPLAEEGERCWKKILFENNISEDVSLILPDCKTAFENVKSPLTNTALVSAKVKIPDVSKPQLLFVKDAVTCNPAP